jgi:hypothetical protein
MPAVMYTMGNFIMIECMDMAFTNLPMETFIQGAFGRIDEVGRGR